GSEITVHLQVAFVDSVRRNLAVVNNGPIQQGEGMGTAPPAGGIGREAVVGGPDVTAVLLQTEELGYLLGEADPLEGAHVLAGRDHKSTVDLVINGHDMTDYHVFFGHALVFSRLFEFVGLQRLGVIALEYRRIDNRLCTSC